MSGKQVNILISSAGRRVTLLQKFREAVNPLRGEVWAGDLNSLAPALYLADRQLALPPVRSAEYVPALLKAVRDHGITAIVPTLDPELPVLSPYCQDFEAAGCSLLVSTPEFNRITGDKWLTVQEFARSGILTPPSWIPEELGLLSERNPGAGEYPELSGLPEFVYIKPRNGSASHNVFRINRSMIPEYAAKIPQAIIQEQMLGEEVTIDALLSPDGIPLHYVPRLRIRTLAGESITGVTVDDQRVPGIRDWCERALTVCGKLGARWAITLQAFDTAKGLVLAEINARFGGGAPLAFAAGGHYPEWVVNLLQGVPVAPRLGDYKSGLYFMRYMTEIFTEDLAWPEK